MDTPNQTSTPSASLKQWWDATQFEGKQFCNLSEEGALSTHFSPDKTIAMLNTITGEAVIQSLKGKFADLEKQAQELSAEWETTDDKLKLMSKVNRLIEHVLNANAIGDFDRLINPLQNFKKEIETLVAQNYKAKEALVLEAEALKIENNNWKELTERLRSIGDEWRNLGFIDKNENEKLWKRLKAVKTKFFEEKREHQDDIEKEMLQNLDFKMELVEKAEALSNSENWKETTEQYKQLFEEWKKIGRTVADKNEQLWQQFIGAKNNFFDRKNLHTEQIKVEQEKNYELKKIIVEKANTLKESTDWSITTKAYAELMDEWKSIGATPAEYGNSLWEEFSAAKDVFFTAKKAQANEFKATLQENYDKKISLIEQVESIKNSSNWRDTTVEMNQLFDEWKQVGFVGKEHTEPLWQRFISARKHFFNRKDQEFKRKREQYEKNKELHFLQSKNFLTTLLQESEDEAEQIVEFTENLQNISEGPKSEELKSHLKNLIGELELRIKNRAKKIEDVKLEVAKLEEQQLSNDSENTDKKITQPEV